MYDVSTAMKQSIVCIYFVSFLGLVLGGSNKLPLKGSRQYELPVFAPRVLQPYEKKGPKAGYEYPMPPPVFWTVSPYPTTAGSVPPSSPPMTYFPSQIVSTGGFPTKPTSQTNLPSSSSLHQAACLAAAQGTVFKTSNDVTFAYFYELLTVINVLVSDVTPLVDSSVQSYLADKLVDCPGRRQLTSTNITILGVSQNTSDSLASSSCSVLSPRNGTEQVCYTIQSTVTIYLEKNNADASLLSKVFGALSNGFSSNFAFGTQQGEILGLYFVGANLPLRQPADTSNSASAVQTGETTSSSSSGLTLSPGSIVVVAAVCLTVIAVAFLVFRRGRKWPAAHKAGITKGQSGRNHDGAIQLDDERSTPTANASFDREAGMFVEYDDDESNGYGKVLANRPILRDMDKDAPSPIATSRTSWFASRSRSSHFAEAESVEIQGPHGSPSRSPPKTRKYSVQDTVDF